MSDAYIQVAADSSGKKVDNEALTVAGSSVYRQRVRLAGLNPTDLANVTTSGGVDVSVTGGTIVVSSLSAGTVTANQGTSGSTPWLILAATSGGNQPISGTVNQGTSGSTPWLVLSATSGGSQPVSIQNTQITVLPTTSGGAVPVSVQNTILSVVASTTGGGTLVYQGTSPWVSVASSTGGPQSVIAATSGGSAPVSVQNQVTVLSATSGGAVATIGVQDTRQTFQATSSNGSLSVTATLRNVATVTFSASSGAAAGITLNFEGSDDGVNFYPLVGARTSDGFAESAPSGLGNATAPRAWDISVGGFTTFRVRQSAWASGLATVGVTLDTADFDPAPGVTQGMIPWQVVASTTGGSQSITGTVTANQGTSGATPWLVITATSGGTAPVTVQNQVTVLAATSGGTAPVTVQNQVTTLSATSGGAIQVVQSTTPWLVVASTTGGDQPTKNKMTVVTATLVAGADLSLRTPTADSLGRAVVAMHQCRQFTASKYLQVTATGETVLYASSSGFYHDLVFMCITPATSNTVSSALTIKDSSGGATQFLLNIPSGGSSDVIATILPLPIPWAQTTATSTGNAWTVNFAQAGTYNISAQFVTWSS